MTYQQWRDTCDNLKKIVRILHSVYMSNRTEQNYTAWKAADAAYYAVYYNTPKG